MNRFTKIEVWLGRTFLVVIAVFLTLFLADVFLARFAPKYMHINFGRTPLPEYWLRPYLMFTGTPRKNGYNELGYNGPLPKLPKPKDELRIFMFGGSTVHNTNPALPELLEIALQKRLKEPVRVYNFGVVSSVSRQDMVRMIIDGYGLQPDLIILYGGGNDLIPRQDPRPNYPHMFLLYELNSFMAPSAWKSSVFTRLVLQSELAKNLFYEKIFSSLDYVAHPRAAGRELSGDDLQALRIKAFVQNAKMARQITNSLGIRFATVLQPLATLKKIPVGQEFKYSNRTKMLTESYESVRAQMRGEPLFDVSDVFDQTKEEVYRDEIHLHGPYQHVLAEELAKRLLPAVKDASAHRAPPSPFAPETEFVLDN